nr:MAG TPA: hypothetical protein [Caudoviricetes sp.]DAV07134.1 MAG TPA: hypothetical protein [Caudoviricetes sp.]
MRNIKNIEILLFFGYKNFIEYDFVLFVLAKVRTDDCV